MRQNAALYLTFSISRPLDFGLRVTRAAAAGSFELEACAGADGAAGATAILLGTRVGAERGAATRRAAGSREPKPAGFLRRLCVIVF